MSDGDVAKLHRWADHLLWQGLSRSLGSTALMCLAALAAAAAMLALPVVYASAVDRAIRGDGTAVGALLVLIGVLTALTLCELLSQLTAPLSSATATRWLRHGIVHHVLSLGMAGRDRFAGGDVVSRLVSNAAEAGGAVPAAAGAVVSAGVSVGGVVALALLDVRLALAFLVGAPLGVLFIKVFVKQTSPLAAAYLAAYGAVADRLVEGLAGIRTIRAARGIDREIDRVLTPAQSLTQLGRTTWRAYARLNWQTSLLGPWVQLTVLAVAAYGVAGGRLSPGQFLATFGYTGLGLGLLGQRGAIMSLARARGAARRLTEVFAQSPTSSGTESLPDGPGELVLREVSVSVDGRPVLDRVNLTVPGGVSVAVVGASAAGKSTLAALAGRLIAPDRGRVMLDGVPIDTVDTDTLRREITFGFERPVLLGATVADAIALGSRVASREEVELAAWTAAADRFIERLPRGYDTPLPDAPMSGGELQRVGLARSLAHCGRLLILDDATSGLDVITEMQVSRALTESLAGRTRLIITHRPATVARCDLVAWLDEGRIRAVAPHHVLWADPGYRAVFTPQEHEHG